MDVGIILTVGGAALAAGGKLIESKQMDRKIDKAVEKRLSKDSDNGNQKKKERG